MRVFQNARYYDYRQLSKHDEVLGLKGNVPMITPRSYYYYFFLCLHSTSTVSNGSDIVACNLARFAANSQLKHAPFERRTATERENFTY